MLTNAAARKLTAVISMRHVAIRLVATLVHAKRDSREMDLSRVRVC